MAFHALQAALGLLVLGLAAAGAGSGVFRRLGAAFPAWERMVFSVLGGWGLLSLALYLIGQISFSRRVIFGSALALAAVGVHFLRKVWRGGELRGLVLERRAMVPATLVIFVLTVTAIAGLAPVTGDWGSDTVAYHLLGPKVWLRSGVIRPVADDCHTAFPQTAETMDAAMYAIGGTAALCLADFFTFGLFLGVIASLARRCGLDAAGGWWAAAIVASMPAVFSGAHGAFVDGLYAAFFLAAVRVALDAESNAEWGVAGIFCGLVMATKYTGLMTVPVLAAFVLILRSSGGAEKWRRTAAGLLIAGGATAAVCGAYYARNWLLLGCPIYPPPPGLVHICRVKYLSTQAVLDFHRYIWQRGAGLGRGPLAFLLLPYQLTYHTSNFNGAGGIGLVPLGLGPLGIYATRKSATTRFLTGVVFLLTLGWFMTQQESRFLINVYAIGGVFGVIGWERVGTFGGRGVRIVAGVLVSVSVLYGMFLIVKPEVDPMHAVFSSAYAAKRNMEQIPYAQSFDYLNGDPSVKEVLILDRSVPPFYLEKNYVKPVGQWGEITVPGVESASQALGVLARLRVTHVLDVNSEIAPFQVRQPTAGLRLVFEARNQRVYRVE